MNILPFLLGATIVFWGWQTGFWIVAVPLAIAYELARYIDWRWNLTTADFRKASHICTVVLVGVLIYLLFSDRSLGLIFSFFQWLPIIFAPLLIAQTYSLGNKVDIQALLFFKDRPDRRELFLLDLTYIYFAICILAASAANTRNILFYVGIVILISGVLIPLRSPRFSALVFLALLIWATALGTVGHIGLHQLQLSLERNTAKFFYGFYRPHSDPTQVSTAIGDIGSVKQSNEIILRVKPAPRQLVPKLLRTAVYNRYASGFWIAAQPEFSTLQPGGNASTWTWGQQLQKPRNITVSEHLEEGSTLLKLPYGSVSATNLPELEKIERNQYGTVQIASDASFLSYQIAYDPNLSLDSPPTEADLKVVEGEKPAIDLIIDRLELIDKTPQATLDTVYEFFNTEFEYSLDLARQGRNKTPLAAFLLNHRSGHCEYFATATALLLRRVGIPARYVVGFSVSELSKLERQYVVRSRNAHAWTQVYVNGKWQVFDTTPASWIAFENRNRSQWQDFKDIFSWIAFQLARITTIFKNLGKSNWLWFLTIPLGGILIREFFGKGGKTNFTMQRINQKQNLSLAAGADSELYIIERELNKLGLGRDRFETWKDWLTRLQNNSEFLEGIGEIEAIVEIHYRYCFDPQGIDSEDRAMLRSTCEEWLKKYLPSTANY